MAAGVRHPSRGVDPDRPVSRRPILLIGVAVLGAYLAVAAGTLAMSGRHLLPLFEGIGPPPPYKWVKPPPAFASGNTPPQPAAADVALSGGTSAQASATTPDGQVFVNLAARALPPHGNDTNVHVTVTPSDPAALAPVPPDLVADGNAYRLALTYQPSNTPVDSIAGSADVALLAPIPAHALLYSADGQSWTKLTSQYIRTTSTMIASITRPGWYLVAATPSAASAVSAPAKKGTSTGVIAIVVAGLAIVLALVPAVRRRGRRHPDPPPAGPPA